MTEEQEREVLIAIRRLNKLADALEAVAGDAPTLVEVIEAHEHRKWLRKTVRDLSLLTGAVVGAIFFLRDGLTLLIDMIADHVSRR